MLKSPHSLHLGWKLYSNDGGAFGSVIEMKARYKSIIHSYFRFSEDSPYRHASPSNTSQLIFTINIHSFHHTPTYRNSDNPSYIHFPFLLVLLITSVVITIYISTTHKLSPSYWCPQFPCHHQLPSMFSTLAYLLPHHTALYHIFQLVPSISMEIHHDYYILIIKLNHSHTIPAHTTLSNTSYPSLLAPTTHFPSIMFSNSFITMPSVSQVLSY